ncbi:MAG: type II toxin-antitoxin system HipA family toxin, partial [Acidobacteriia bacterium]|nr:type II toxin-antitoxin system HipA family toxin [Terriglobia bacterium]
MSKQTKRVRVAIGERLQPVGEIVFETDGRRQTSMFRYAVEWLENPQRFPIAPSMPLGESQFYASA